MKLKISNPHSAIICELLISLPLCTVLYFSGKTEMLKECETYLCVPPVFGTNGEKSCSFVVVFRIRNGFIADTEPAIFL